MIVSNVWFGDMAGNMNNQKGITKDLSNLSAREDQANRTC